MSNEHVRVEADGAELEAPRDQAVTAVLEEGDRPEHVWTAADFADGDWEHPDTRPGCAAGCTCSPSSAPSSPAPSSSRWPRCSAPAPGSRSRSTA